MKRLVAMLAGGLALCGAGARADDWPQHQHDRGHTGASKDPIKLPLTDIWSWPGAGPCSLANGRLYFVAAHGSVSELVCADARTGSPHWKQRLWTRPDSVYIGGVPYPPLVSSGGVVYTLDAQRAPGSFVHAIRAFNAVTGQPLASYASPTNQPVVATSLLLHDGAGPLATELLPLGPFRLIGAGPSLITPQLLLQGELVFGRLDPWPLMAWNPATPPTYGWLRHVDQDRELKPQKLDCELDRFLAANLSGLFLAGKWRDAEPPGPGSVSSANVLAKLDGTTVRWHRDLPWTVRSPIVDDTILLARLEGNGSGQTMMAFDPATGQTRWLFPRQLPAPLVKLQQTLSFPGGVSSGLAGAASRLYLQFDRVVLADGRACFSVPQLGLVAVDQRTGEPQWNRPELVWGALGASRDHVFATRVGNGTDVLVAARLQDGKPEWTQEFPGSLSVRSLALGNGFLYAQSVDGAHAFAPAERTFSLAVDSPDPKAYARDAEGKQPDPGALADASIVRLPWNEPLADSNRKLEARKKAAPGAPLILELDWLDSQRASVLGAPAGKATELPDRKAFLARCRALAAEYQPTHLNLAPEVNVFLARNPDRAAPLGDLLRDAVREVRQVSPATSTLLSLNCEVAYGYYGRGSATPFGRLDLPPAPNLEPLRPLLALVDAVGLTACPQAAFTTPVDVPRDYFTALKRALGAKRVLVTGLRALLRENSAPGQLEQALYLKHLTQGCYWLDAEVVAYPDTQRPDGSASREDAALQAGDQVRRALSVWRELLHWERVDRLTLAANAADRNPAAAPN